MAKFDLKVAFNLLPVLKDDEASTKQLIDGIEYYQSELDQEGQNKLVNFVLKSRLSQAAKLKLDNKYESVDCLIKAMKTHLLPKKSATALQRKLFNMRQNDLSIDEYGKQISDLFVDLTISQSEGNETSFSVLKPINEKQAIKSFADGLWNRRLSTIIAARNYSSLSDAVQAAIDEQMTSPSTSGDILAMRYNNRNNFYQNRNFRGRFRNRGQHTPGRGQVPDQGIQSQADDSSWTGGQFRGRGAPRSSRGNRGKIFYSRSRNAEGDEQEMHILTDSGSQENKESKESEHDKFFVNKNVILSCNNVCHINLNINPCGDLHTWLIDTGASISAIKYEHVIENNIPIQKETLVVDGIGGKVQAIGYVYINLYSGDHTVSNKFFVFKSLPCKASGILGQDFLSKYKSVLNLGNNSIQLWNENIKIDLPITSENNLLTIPARSESVHFIKTEIRQECVVCATEVKEGLYLASTLSKPINGRIPVRFLNTTGKDIDLKDFKPTILLANDYNVCEFAEPTTKYAERVKHLFPLLNLNHLKTEERDSIKNICAKYNDLFYLKGDKLTATKIYKHSINLKPETTPLYSKPYRLPHSQKGEIRKQIDNMLEQGIIEPCNSEWSSPVLLVPKKTDINGLKKWRLVIDYRKLNNCIQDDKFPLPNISEILDSLSGCIYFSHLDLNQGFYNVELEPDSRKYTAFCSGQFQMTRMPMGLKTSPSSFSRMMTMAMTGLCYEKCLCYQDDLIVFGRSLAEHNRNLIDIFERLREVNLKLNPVKCNFLQKELLYLGHIVSGEGVLPDPEK